MSDLRNSHIQFVTGRLAEHGVRECVQQLAEKLGFRFTLDVLPITVAALMTTKWAARHVKKVDGVDFVVLPGYCQGDLQLVQNIVGYEVRLGPRDFRDLPRYLRQLFGIARSVDLGDESDQAKLEDYDIEIIAEINHAPRLTLDDILNQAKSLANEGADVIDIGCEPGDPWRGVADVVRAVRDLGLRVSIDSLNPVEIEPAVRAGASLVLSVNSANRDAAPDWGVEVVVIPDDFATLQGLDETIDFLANRQVKLRLDPVVEPIGCGFAASLGRYLDVRRRYPDAEIMMGIGNLTELTDADSAGINLLLLGFCQELGIRSVLTTQVINWAKTSVRECDLARRLVHHAVKRRIPPKRIDPSLVTLRDDRLYEYGHVALDRLADEIKDQNYRLFVEEGAIHLLAAKLHLHDTDPFALFDKLLDTNPKNVDVSHAFYMGFELAKAMTALTLSKQYRQDESLNWGYLTTIERTHRLRPRRNQ